MVFWGFFCVVRRVDKTVFKNVSQNCSKRMLLCIGICASAPIHIQSSGVLNFDHSLASILHCRYLVGLPLKLTITLVLVGYLYDGLDAEKSSEVLHFWFSK